MSLELQRYGRGPDGFPYILTALPDGYWTPWHVADQQIRRLETRVEELEAGQAVGEAEDLRREVDGLRDLLHRMLEAPTTQVSVTWKDAVRQALGNEPGQPAEPDEKVSPDGLRYKLPPLTMTGHQLRQALEFCCDDLDTVLHVALRPGGTDTEGEKVEAGLCCWLAEYPEEGSILLDGRSLHDVPAGQADAQPVAPAAWLQPVCRYISDTLATGTPNERTVARTIMHMLPLDEALAAAPPARQPLTGDRIARISAALVVARDGYISERATGQACVEGWRERTIERLDAAIQDMALVKSGIGREGE